MATKRSSERGSGPGLAVDMDLGAVPPAHESDGVCRLSAPTPAPPPAVRQSLPTRETVIRDHGDRLPPDHLSFDSPPLA
ncbi:MAG: hypothetical protein KDD66_11850 [Bdellovibrionales bacterium]|nr:hypothetical protein [Bdellovibrionales bacterium]